MYIYIYIYIYMYIYPYKGIRYIGHPYVLPHVVRHILFSIS